MVGPLALSTHEERARVSILRLPVDLDDDERERYERLSAPYARLRTAYLADAKSREPYEPRARSAALLHRLGQTPDGRSAVRNYTQAVQIASFPKAKRILVSSLLRRHRSDRTLVFTSRIADAYRIAEDELVAVIAGDVLRAERDRVLAKFQDGRLRALVAGGAFDDGEIELPSARIAIVVSAIFGPSRQLARHLRAPPGKRPLIYELITRGTVDELRGGPGK